MIYKPSGWDTIRCKYQAFMTNLLRSDILFYLSNIDKFLTEARPKNHCDHEINNGSLRRITQVKQKVSYYPLLWQKGYEAKRNCFPFSTKNTSLTKPIEETLYTQRSEFYLQVTFLKLLAQYIRSNKFHQVLQMSCKDNLILILIIVYMLAFLGYLVISIFVVPVNVDCAGMNDIPEDAALDLSMGDWISSNMIAGIIIFGILTSLSKAKKGDSKCLMVFFIIVSALYCLFEIVWGTIGVILFQQTYHDACAYSDSFNSYVIAELAYGMILFPSVPIWAIALAIISLRKDKTRANPAECAPLLNQPILGGDITAAQPQQTPNRNSNVYQDIYSRLSGSFGSSSEGRIN